MRKFFEWPIVREFTNANLFSPTCLSQVNSRQSFLVSMMANIFLIAIAICILYLRNSDAVLNPILYAEDGKWVGEGLTNGWLHTFINARKDYFVWGNLILMWISVRTSIILCGNPLNLLPLCVAIYSYLFYASIATLAFFVSSDHLSKFARLLLYLLILLIPFGDSSSEILGRLSNIGYSFVFLTILLLIARERNELLNLKGVSIDTLLLLCIGTNPVSTAIIGVYLGATYFKEKKDSLKEWLTGNAYLMTGLLVISIALIYRYTVEGLLISRGVSGPGIIEWGHMIEVIAARSILYPFVFGIYGELANWSSLILLACWAGLIVFALRKPYNPKSRSLIIFCLISLTIYVAATIFLRPYLTHVEKDYTFTYPDRYYYGPNFIVILITTLSIDNLLRAKKERYLAIGLVASILLVYGINYAKLFEGVNPRTKLMTGLTFRDQLFSYSNSWSQHMTPYSEFSSGKGGIPLGEMVSGIEYSQLMPVDNDFVSGIALELATFARNNSGSLIVSVTSEDGRYFIKRAVDLKEVADCEFYVIDFGNLWENMFGQHIRVSIVAPDSTRGNAVTVLMTKNLLGKKYEAQIQDEPTSSLSWSYKILTNFSKERPLKNSDIIHLPTNPVASSWSMPIQFGEINVSAEAIANSEYSVIASGYGVKPLGELVKGSIYSQVIPIPFKRLSGVSLYLATYARTNTGRFDVSIKSNDGRYSLRRTIEMKDVADCEYLKIHFDNDWYDMNGKELEVMLTTPDGIPGNNVTIMLTKNLLASKYEAKIGTESISHYVWNYRIFVN